MRQRDGTIRALRDFLLWNQGTAPTFDQPLPVAAITSGPLAKVGGSRVPLPVPVPATPPASAAVGYNSTSAVTPNASLPVVVAKVSTVDMSKRVIPASSTAATPPVVVAKIDPIPLWKNSSVPTPQFKGTATMNSNPSSPAGLPSSSSLPAANGAGGVSSSAATPGSGVNKRPLDSPSVPVLKIRVKSPSRPPNRRPPEVVELLSDDDDGDYEQYNDHATLDDELPVLASSFPTASAAAIPPPAISKPTSSTSSSATSVKISSLPSSTAASTITVKSSSVTWNQMPPPPPYTPPHQPHQPHHHHQQQQQSQQDQVVRSLAQRYQVDENFVRKALRESGNNMFQAQVRISQYRVDVEEARMEDQARLMSENTAVNDKQRAVQERESKLGTPQALAEFSESELLKHTRAIQDILSKEAARLGDDEQRALRKLCVEFLDQEKKAIKWYRDSARAYMRSRKAAFEVLSKAEIEKELVELKTIMYSTPSERGAPLAFLAALDSEAGQAQMGVVLGLSADAPVELL